MTKVQLSTERRMGHRLVRNCQRDLFEANELLTWASNQMGKHAWTMPAIQRFNEDVAASDLTTSEFIAQLDAGRYE